MRLFKLSLARSCIAVGQVTRALSLSHRGCFILLFSLLSRDSSLSRLSPLSHSEIDLNVTVYIVPSPDESKLLYTSTAAAAVSKVYTHNIQTYIGIPLCTFRRRRPKRRPYVSVGVCT